MAVNLMLWLKSLEMKIFWSSFHQHTGIKYVHVVMLGPKMMKVCVTVSQIASAPQEADIKQLSRLQQQMSIYNCTRPQNNRNSVC